MAIPPTKPDLGPRPPLLKDLSRHGEKAQGPSPLDGVLSQGADWAIWPPITAKTLTEGTERRLIREAPGKVALAPYGGFDASRPPVVLVHGLMTPKLLTWLAERLHKESGRQVFIVFHDDMGTRVHVTGRYIARQLAELLRHHPSDVDLALVGQCIGGLAARCALNYLYQPNWYGDAGADLPRPHAGLKTGRLHIALHMVDTKRGGFVHEPPDKTDGQAMRIIRFLLRAVGRESLLDYRATSLVYSRLYAVRLPPNVCIRNYTVAKPPGTKAFGGVTELGADEAAALAEFLVHGKLPPDDTPRLQSLGRGLEQEEGYRAFKAAFLARLGSPLLLQSQEAIRKALAGAYSQKMLHFPMTKQRGAISAHIRSLSDDPLLENELIDVLVRAVTVS